MKTFKRLMALNLSLVFLLTGYFQASAALTDDTELSLQITAGTLDVTADATASFASTAFSFSGQNNTGNDLGTVNVSDTRGTYVGWTVNITGEDWSDGSHAMNYDGDGAATGQLSLNPAGANLASVGGQDTTSITMGANDSFDAGTTNINLVTAASGYGSGEYNITNLLADQYIKGNQESGTYQMTLTLTAS